ncbi:MAG: flagellar biosynthetic protein FliO, partial [Dehalococcoidia bacterium]
MMRPQPRTPSIRRQAPVLAALLAGLVAAMATSTPAFAQEAAPGAGGIAGYGLWDWLSLVVRIGAVLLVIWASVLAMRWYVRRMNGEAGGRSARQLQIVETRALGPNRALHLVRLGDRAVLIGATAERI